MRALKSLYRNYENAEVTLGAFLMNAVHVHGHGHYLNCLYSDICLGLQQND